MNKNAKMMGKFMNTIKNFNDGYLFYVTFNMFHRTDYITKKTTGHSALYDACYMTHAFNALVGEKGCEDIATYPLTDENGDIVGVSIYGMYNPWDPDNYYEVFLHKFYFSAKELKTIRENGWYNGGFN